MKLSFLSALTVLSLSFAGASAQAGYADKLKSLQEKIEVNFSGLLTEMQKAQAVNTLYSVVATGKNADIYGQNKLVTGVYVQSPEIGRVASAKVEGYSHLRDHTLIMNFDGTSLDLFEKNQQQEVALLQKIDQLSAQLKALYPKATVTRELDGVTETTSSNKTYADLLQNWVDVLQADVSPELAAQLEDVTLVDSPDFFKNANASLYPSYYNSQKKSLIVSVGRLQPMDGDSLVADKAALDSAVKAVTQNSFSKVETYVLDAKNVQGALTELSQFLTPETSAFLKSNGVTSLTLIENPETATSLLDHGNLKLGKTRAENENIVNLLFR